MPLLAIAPHVTAPSWMVIPFALLLLSIAIMPLLAAEFWEKHYAKVALALGAIVAGYYAFVLHSTVPLVHAAQEYVSFIALVGSLFVISGGINIRVKGEATPWLNVVFLAVAAVLANIIGTTGASMLLIRPWIRSNKYRITGLHIVFFIFIVSNCGGCLTPVGDPPLFIGFLRGVPFWWVLQHCWQAWLLCNGLLLGIFYALDLRNFKRAPVEVRDAETHHEEWTFLGLHNLALLVVVLASVFIDANLRAGPFTLTSITMIAAAVVSWFTTHRDIHEANDFSWHPVQEVGFLFVGIFLTMLPALDMLATSDILKLDGPLAYYFATGTLSAFLDNAPTYLAFLAAEMGHYHLDASSPADVIQFVGMHPHFLIAVSLGAVFFGAGSYIGNGPNFMVKSIAEKANVNMPSFVGYMLKFSLPILVPVLALVGWIMIHGGH